MTLTLTNTIADPKLGGQLTLTNGHFTLPKPSDDDTDHINPINNVDARIVFDVGKSLRLWPHARLNAQTGTNFYQLAYALNTSAATTQVPSLPLYRTDDRELSPLVTATVGGGTHLALTSPEAKTQYGVSIQGDVAYTQFFDAIYVLNRTAIFGSIGFDAEFE